MDGNTFNSLCQQTLDLMSLQSKSKHKTKWEAKGTLSLRGGECTCSNYDEWNSFKKTNKIRDIKFIKIVRRKILAE